MAHLLRAFRHRNYRLFFSGQIISLTGTWMQSVAESWLVYRLTGSAALLGVTAFCTHLPVFLHLEGIQGISADLVRTAADHVTAFSLGGMAQVAAAPSRARRRRKS